MRTIREFELEAIQIMGSGVLTPDQLTILESLSRPAEYEYTGSGYFLKVQDPSLPEAKRTLSSPPVVGEFDGIICGFVVYLGNRELTLECHTWGPVDVPEGFRDCAVSVRTDPSIAELR